MVRCAACGHEWRQSSDPDFTEEEDDTEDALEELVEMIGDEAPSEEDLPLEEELPEAFSQALEDASEQKEFNGYGEEEEESDSGETIPESVKPVSEEGVPSPALQEEGVEKNWKPAATGYAAAAGVFICVLGILVLLKNPVYNAWPATALLYGVLGADVPLPGEGLAIDRIQANYTRDRTLNVKGSVINLTGHDNPVPPLLASLKDKDGVTLESWIIQVAEDTLPPEGEIVFTAAYPGLPESAQAVNLTFSRRATQHNAEEKAVEDPHHSDKEPAPAAPAHAEPHH